MELELSNDDPVVKKEVKQTETQMLRQAILQLVDTMRPKKNVQKRRATDPSEWDNFCDPRGYVTKAQQIEIYKQAGQNYQDFMTEQYPNGWEDVSEEEELVMNYREDSEMDVYDGIVRLTAQGWKTPPSHAPTEPVEPAKPEVTPPAESGGVADRN